MVSYNKSGLAEHLFPDPLDQISIDAFFRPITKALTQTANVAVAFIGLVEQESLSLVAPAGLVCQLLLKL